MQLSRRGRGDGQKPRGFIATGAEIVRRETPLGLNKGLGAVVAGIVIVADDDDSPDSN